MAMSMVMKYLLFLDLCPLSVSEYYDFSSAPWWPVEAFKNNMASCVKRVISANGYEYGHEVSYSSGIFFDQ